MVKRRSAVRKRFLKKRGLKKIPRGKEIDHKVPLHRGGTDTLRNLHLIKKSAHKRKTAREAKKGGRR